MKKILAIILTATMILTLLAVPAMAGDAPGGIGSDEIARRQASGALANLASCQFSFPLEGEYGLTATLSATAEEVASGSRGLPSVYQFRDLGGAEFHDGLDIWAAEGTPVYAAASGVVQEAHLEGCGGPCDELLMGNHIVVNHENGYYTLYAHLEDLCVQEGSWVNAGDMIGHVGHTGRCVGPEGNVNPDGNHLHFAICSDCFGYGYYGAMFEAEAGMSRDELVAFGMGYLFQHYGCTNPLYYFGDEAVQWANSFYTTSAEACAGDGIFGAEEVWCF